jgi:dienelactone hydrolase
LIYLHHQTGTAADFVDRDYWFKRMTGVRVVLPEAPKIKSEWYASAEDPKGELTCWYDYVPNPGGKYGTEVPLEDTMQECRDRILRVVQDEVALVGSASRVFIGGESQGAVAAFHCAVDPRMPLLGGIVATSGAVEAETLPHESKVNLPVRFYIAGKDDIYPPKKTVAQLERFKKAGFTDVKHKIHPKAIHASDWANGWINEFVREMQAKDRAPRTKRAVDLTPAAAVPPAEEPLPPAAAAETSADAKVLAESVQPSGSESLLQSVSKLITG